MYLERREKTLIVPLGGLGGEWVARRACLWYDFFRSLSHFTPAAQATKINVLVKLRNLVGGRRID